MFVFMYTEANLYFLFFLFLDIPRTDVLIHFIEIVLYIIFIKDEC